VHGIDLSRAIVDPYLHWYNACMLSLPVTVITLSSPCISLHVIMCGGVFFFLLPCVFMVWIFIRIYVVGECF